MLIFEETEIKRVQGETKIPMGRGDRPRPSLPRSGGSTALEHWNLKPKALDPAATFLLTNLGKSQGLGEPASLLANGVPPHFLLYRG